MIKLHLIYKLMDKLVIIGDLVHIWALIYLLVTILTTRSASGVSYRTQEIFLLVFLTRYSDVIIMDHPFHLQLAIVRTIFILITILIIYYTRLRLPYSKTYNKDADSFPNQWIYIATVIISILFPHNSSLYGYLWTFSIWLEAFSIIPQYYMLFNQSETTIRTANFVWILAIYRSFYLIHWIIELQHTKIDGIIAAVLQIIIYAIFLYQFIAKRKRVEFMSLPH